MNNLRSRFKISGVLAGRFRFRVSISVWEGLSPADEQIVHVPVVREDGRVVGVSKKHLRKV